jgi:hypothetical protein
MQTLASFCLVAALVVSLGVGGRLIALWYRTRALPELLLGVAFLGTGIGNGFAELGRRVLWTESGSLTTAMNAGLFAFSVVGTCALFGVIRTVFRRNTAGTVLLAMFCVVTWGAFGARFALGDFATGRVDSWANHLYVSMRMTVFVWAALESFEYFHRLRKRLALGLASPLVSAQILLWGLAATCSAGMTFVTGACYVNYRIDPLTNLISTAFLTIFAAGTVVSIWCSFFPPEILRSYVLNRYPAEQSTA